MSFKLRDKHFYSIEHEKKVIKLSLISSVMGVFFSWDRFKATMFKYISIIAWNETCILHTIIALNIKLKKTLSNFAASLLFLFMSYKIPMK